jgi:DNA-binding transcriptional MerR regulator
MLTISQLGRRFGLSRSTLLYYDSLGLLRPTARTAKNYRLYSEEDAARLELICTYRRAGLPLADVTRVLAAPEGALREALHRRLEDLNGEIQGLRRQQKVIVELLRHDLDLPATRFLDKEGWVEILRATGLSEEEMHQWHVEFERRSPEAHRDFLESLGIEDQEVARIRQWSRLENP